MELTSDKALRRNVIALASPVVAAMISQTLINQADHILVGRLPESESVPGQAALQVSVMLLWAVGGALNAISVGTQALTARRLGAGDPLAAGQVLANSLTISATLGLLSSILFWFLTPLLFPLISKDPAVIALGVPFLRWRYLQLLPMVVAISYKAFFDGLGKTWVHMGAAFVMNVVNFVLNIGLIFGKWGLPRMGVEGSGLASCIASYIGAALMIGWSLRPSLGRRFRYYRLGILKGDVAKEIGSLSWPSAAAAFFAMSGFLIFMRIVGRLDIAANHVQPIFAAATANIINILQLVFISCIAYGTATSTLVGQNMGAKHFQLAERYVWTSLKIGVAFFSLLGLFTICYPDLILHAWSKDQMVIDAARPILRAMGAFEPVACAALVFTYALYGAGNPRFVMYTELILHFTCLVPLSYLFGMVFDFGLWGSWIAMMLYMVLLAGIMGYKFSRGTWKAIQI